MRCFFLSLLLASGVNLLAQRPNGFFADSLKKCIAEARTPGDKIHLLLILAAATTDSMQAEVYAGEAVSDAELGRDRRLMAEVYVQNGGRYLDNGGLVGNQNKAQRQFEQAEQVAREAGLAGMLTESYCWLSRVWRIKGDNEKALAYSNQAEATAINTDNDTAKVAAYISMGETYLNIKQMPLAFQNFSEALTLAEVKKSDKLLRSAYVGLMRFYLTMHEYGKAIDYTMRGYELDRRMWSGIDMLVDLYRLGDLFGYDKKWDLAKQMYEHSLALADTLHYDVFKINSYFRLLSMYFRQNEYGKGLQYMLGHPEMLDFLNHSGYAFYLGHIKAVVFTKENRLDSALHYFTLEEPEVTVRGSKEIQCDFWETFGEYYVRRRDYPKAIGCYKNAYGTRVEASDLEEQVEIADTLWRLYERVGDFRGALTYNQLAAAERDSLRAKTQETELMKLEVETENRRKERVAREEEVNTERRHNIQYMGFTAGLVLLFISIVLLGRLPVPVPVIRTVVFLSFIFLFEFIILLLDRTIQAWTHEEPWKVLCIKIVLAAGLVPLHHWLEHRVIHYLSRRRQPAASGYKNQPHAGH